MEQKRIAVTLTKDNHRNVTIPLKEGKLKRMTLCPHYHCTVRIEDPTRYGQDESISGYYPNYTRTHSHMSYFSFPTPVDLSKETIALYSHEPFIGPMTYEIEMFFD